MAGEGSFSVEIMEEGGFLPHGFFPHDWATRVKQILHENSEERNNIKQLLRVPKAVLSGNPQAYVPESISLGPYHYNNFKGEEQDEVMKMSTQEAYKVKSAAILSHRITKYDESWNAIFEMIVEILPEIGRFYQLQITGGEQYNFALMMMVDSFFLVYFMYSLSNRPDYVENGDIVKRDILKLENQLPLSLLKGVYEKVKGVLLADGFDSYDYQLWNTCLELSPIFFCHGAEDNEPHLLGFLHTSVSPCLRLQFPQSDNSQPTLRQRMSRFVDQYVVEKICGIFFCFNRPIHPEPPIKKYTTVHELAKDDKKNTAGKQAKAEKRSDERVREKAGIKYTTGELAKAGIKFDWGYDVEFDKYSRTLYLPQMTVSSVQTTEVFFRNLLALEFLDTARPKCVTEFIQLMDCLIYTAEDVHVLMKCGVIISSQSTLSEERIAKMWDSICQSSRGPEEPSVKQLKVELKELLIEKYYQTKIRIMVHDIKSFIFKSYREYHKEYLSKPWNVVALLVGTVILAMNMVQAYCSLYVCNVKPSN